jgi:hypothetical protein
MPQQSVPEDIEYRTRLKWASEFQYTTRQHGIEDVLVDNYFHNISRRYLQPGDIIYVAVLRDKDTVWDKAIFEVTKMDLKTTIITMISDWTTNAPAKTKKKAA